MAMWKRTVLLMWALENKFHKKKEKNVYNLMPSTLSRLLMCRDEHSTFYISRINVEEGIAATRGYTTEM